MLSTQNRLRLLEITQRIEKGEEVSLSDMTWATKLANHNRSAYSILRKARRRLTNPPLPDTIDQLLHDLDLGDDDPNSHITNQSSVDDLANFFCRKPHERLNPD